MFFCLFKCRTEPILTIESKRRYAALLSLIIAGEAVFFFSFIFSSVFRPTLLAFFEINNTQLGVVFSAYGIIAMASYILGGPLADRFPARRLMAFALWLTSLGGVIITFVHSPAAMVVTYAFWGFTTIFLFWAAMIRATREWGGKAFQGSAFGWLEGGRGAVAALLGTLSWIIFAQLSPGVSPEEMNMKVLHPYQVVILVTSGLTMAAGILVWHYVPEHRERLLGDSHKVVLKKILLLLRLPTVWLLAIIIVCAYSSYKVTDNFSLYAREVLGFSEVNAAATGTMMLWLRSIVAISAGMLADRLHKVHMIMFLFTFAFLGAFLLSVGWIDGNVLLILINLTALATGIYGIRALYFAVLREARIPLLLTGAAVGLVSFVGYTPDVFMGPLMGALLDGNPGAPGHHHVFMVLAGFSLAGLFATVLFNRFSQKPGP